MSRIRLFGTAVVAVLAVSAIAAASAFAAFPNVLPAGTAGAPLKATTSSGTSTFGSGFTTLTSEKSEGTAELTSEKSGPFDQLFLVVHDLLGRKCTGLEDTVEGSVLAKGEAHYRFSPGNVTPVLVSFLLKEVHFSCGTTLVVVKGCVLGVVSEPYNTPVKSSTVTLTKSGTDNTTVKVENEAGTGSENCELLAAENEKAFSLSAQETTQTLTGFTKSGTAVEPTVMTK
jgi:hypothetical protein